MGATWKADVQDAVFTTVLFGAAQPLRFVKYGRNLQPILQTSRPTAVWRASPTWVHRTVEWHNEAAGVAETVRYSGQDLGLWP